MVVADVIITSIILFFLWSNRGGNIRSTDDLLTRLFRVTFASQLPPTLLAIATTIVYSIKNDSPNAIPFVCIQGKVYGISLLHTLNMRETWRRPDVIQADTAGAIEFQQPAQSTAWKARITVETHQHMVADRTAATASKWHSQTNDVDDAKSIGTSSVELSTLGDTGLASHFEKQAPVDAIV
ncbi:hypothetical protein FRC07_011508 [Ceratobasidium sp. 392]|nr:hypothetical protein FRC07_011508 [Ceratobasidium sp. 392]